MGENKSLGDKFAGFTSDPNPEVWKNIERSLDEKPHRRGFAWIFLAAGAFAAIIAWNFLGEAAPRRTKRVSRENAVAKPAAPAAFPSGEGAEDKPAQNEFLPGSLQPGPGRSLTQKWNPKISYAVAGQPSHSSLNKVEALSSAREWIAALKASGSIGNDSIAGVSAHAPEDKLSPENVTEEAIANTLPDSCMPAQQDAETKMKKIEPSVGRWQLQAQVGASVSRKDEMLVPSQNDLYVEGTGNAGSGGNLPAAPGNPPIVKPYRSMTSSYSVLASYTPIGHWRLTTGFSYLRYYMYTLDDRNLHSGAHYIQVPAIADLKLLDKPGWEWSLGAGASLGYVFEKKSAGQFSSWRSDLILQTSWRYVLTQRILLQVQPQARFVFWDREAVKAGKLSPWYWGGNIGAIWCF